MTFLPSPKFDSVIADAIRPGLVETGETIADNVRAETGRSRRLAPYGRKMFVAETETGARVGTTWGPAVPIEYGTVRTAPKRILMRAAEMVGRFRP